MTRIAVIGAGAIGSVLSAFLVRANEEVTLIGRPGQVSAIRQDGLHVEGARGSLTEHVATAEGLQFHPDFTFLTVKTQDVVTALQANQKFLVDSPLVTFQNGVQSDELAARILPRQNISSVVVNISASYLTPGTVTVIYPGWLVVGRPFGKPDAQLESLAVILRQVARTAISTNILGVHWLKLIFNLNNAFPALLNTSLHQAYAVPYIRQLAARVMREGLQIAQRAKIRLDSLPEASVTLFRILGVLPPVLAGTLNGPQHSSHPDPMAAVGINITESSPWPSN